MEKIKEFGDMTIREVYSICQKCIENGNDANCPFHDKVDCQLTFHYDAEEIFSSKVKI